MKTTDAAVLDEPKIHEPTADAVVEPAIEGRPRPTTVGIEDAKIYLARNAIDGTEMIVWRGQGVVYYLVGEDDNQLKSAAGEMGVKVRI